MDKSSIPIRGKRLSLSIIDEDSVWEKSIHNSPSSSSEESATSEKTPEKAKQKIKSLEEVVLNVQLDYDTLKEYTVLERQVLNCEKLADLSRSLAQPDLLASLENSSLIMDRSRLSFANEEVDSHDCKMNESNSGDAPTEPDNPCSVLAELQLTIDNQRSEIDGLKKALEEKESYLHEILDNQSQCTETPVVAELQKQIKELKSQNEQYKESLDALMKMKETYEKMNVVDLQNQIEMLQDENDNLRQDAESNHRFKELFEEQKSNLCKFQEEVVEGTRNLQNQINTLQNQRDALERQVEISRVHEQQFEEQARILKSLKDELDLPEDAQDIVGTLRDYIADLREKYNLAEIQLNSHDTQVEAPEYEKTITELKDQIANLTKQLEDANEELLNNKNLNIAEQIDSPESVVNGSDQSKINSLLAEIEAHKSEIEGLKSTLREFEANVKAEENCVADYEEEIREKDLIIAKMECKTNVLSSYMAFLTKHLEKLSDNNNAVCLLVKEKSDEVSRLEKHLVGVRIKLRKFIDEKEMESDPNVSSFFYDLFDSNKEETPSETDEVEDELQDDTSILTTASEVHPTQSIADALSTSKSFVDFSQCLSILLSTSDTTINSSKWLNDTANYFHQLFDSVSLSNSAEKSVCDRSFADASNYFSNLFNTPNVSVVDKTVDSNENNDQTLDGTSNYWHCLFDSFRNVSEVNQTELENSTNCESILNTTNMLRDLFKSQNISANKSLNITTETSNGSVLNASNNLSLLFRSRDDSMNKSLNISKAPNNLSMSKSMNELQSRNVSVNNSFDELNESRNVVEPEIALCDGTMNSTAMFNGNYTCSEDPLKSFCADSTLLQVPSSPGFIDETLPAEESEFDLFMSPESLLRKIVDLKVLLNQFEDGIENLSVRKINVNDNTDSLVKAFNVLMKSYASAYNNLKCLVKSYDMDSLVLDGFEMSLRESSDPINLTLKYEAVEKKLHDLSVGLSDHLLVSNLEDQIDLETVASKSLEETINQKESELEELRNSMFKLEVTEMSAYEDEDASADEVEHANNITTLENELVGLKNDLESKEQKIKELSLVLEELKVKDESLTKLQSCYNDLLTKVKFGEEIISGIRKELNRFEEKSSSRKEKISSLLTELNFKDDVIKRKSSAFEEIEERFTEIEDEARKLRDENPAEPVIETTSWQGIKVRLINLLDGKVCIEEGLLDLLSEVGVLKAVFESKESALELRLQDQELRIKELTQWNLEELRNKTQDLDQQLNTKESAIKKLMEQIGEFGEDKEYFETELIKLMKQVDALTSELEDKDVEMSMLREDTRITLEEMKEILKQNMLEVIITEKMSHESRLSELVAQLNALQTEKEQNDFRLQLLDQTQIKLSDLEKELEEKNTLSVQLEKQVKIFEEDKQEHEEKMAKLLEEVDSLKALMESKEPEIVNLKSLLESKEEVISSLKSLLEDKESKLCCLKSLLDEKESEIGSLTSLLVEKESEIGSLKSLSEDKDSGVSSLKSLVENKDSEIDLLKSHVEKIETEINSLKSLLEGKDVEISGLKSLLEEKDCEDNSLKSLLENKDSEISKLNSLLEARDTEIDCLKIESRDLEALKQNLAELTEEKASCEKQISQLMEELNILRANEAQNNIRLQQIELAEVKLADMKVKLEEKEAVANQLESKLRDFEADNKQIADKLKLMMEETDNLREESKNLAALEENAMALVKEMAGKDERIEELTSQVSKLEKAITQSESSEEVVEELCLKLNRTEQDLEEKQSLLTEFQKKYETCEEEKTHLLNEMESLRKDSESLGVLKKTLAELTEDNANKTKEIEDLLKELNDFEVEKKRNTQLQEIAEQADLKLSKTELELTEKQQRVSELEHDKQYLEDQMMSLMEKVDTLKEQLRSQGFDTSKGEISLLAVKEIITVVEEEKTVTDKQSSQSEQAKASEDADQQCSELEAKLREREELISQLKEKLQKLNQEKLSKESEVSVLLQKLDDYQAKVETQLNEIDKLSKLTGDLERQVQELKRNEVGQLNSSSMQETPNNEVKEALTENDTQEFETDRLLKEISNLSEANAKLRIEAAILVEEKSDLIKDYECKIAEKTKKLSDLLSEIESGKEQVNNLTSELSELEKCRKEKNEVIADMQKQLTEMQASLAAKSTEIESLKTQVKSKQSESDAETPVELKTDLERKEVEDLMQKLAGLEADVLVKTEEISKLSKDLEQKCAEVSTLEQQLSETQNKLDGFEDTEALEEMKIKLKTSEETVSVFQQKMDALEEEIRSKKEKEEENEKEWLKKFARLHEEVDSKMTEIASLKEEVANVESKDAAIVNLEAKLRKLESTLNDSDDLRESMAAKQNLIEEIRSLKPEAMIEEIPFSGLVKELMVVVVQKQEQFFFQLTSEFEALKKENKFLKTKEGDTKKWLTELESENTKYQTLIKEKDDEISSSSEKLSALKNELKDTTDLVGTLQSQLEMKEGEITQLRSKMSELKDTQQTAEELKLQNNEINKLNVECDSLRSKLQKEEDVVSSLNKLIEEEIAKFTELNGECVKLRQELAEVLDANKSLKSSLVCKDDEINQLKESLDRNVCSIDETNELKNKLEEAINFKKALSADVTTLLQAVDEKTELIKTLESQVSRNTEEVSSLKKDLEEKSVQISSLSKVVDEKMSEIVQLNSLLHKGPEKAIVAASQVTEDAEKTISSLNAEIKVLKDSLSKHKLEHEESIRIKSESNKLKDQVQKLMEDMKLLQSKLLIEKNHVTFEKNRVNIISAEVKTLEEEKTKLTKNLIQLEAEKAKLMEQLKNSSPTLENSPSSSIKKTNDLFSTPNSSMFKRSKECEKLNRKNTILEKKVVSLMEKEGKLVEIEESLKALVPSNSPVSSATSLIGLLKQKIAEADENLMRMSKELSQKDCLIAQQTDSFNRMKLAFEKKIEELTKALEHNKEKIAALTAALNESEEKRKTLDEECVLTWQNCNSLEKDLANALKRESELKRKLLESTTISESCLLSDGDLAKLKEEKNVLMQENSELTTQMRSLKNEKRQMVSDFYKVKAKAKDAEAELAIVKKRVSALEEERQVLETKNNGLKRRLSEVTAEKDNLSSNLNNLLSKYDSLETSKNNATDSQLSSLKTQVQKLKTELAEKSAKITMLELQIESENFPYRSKVVELETNIASYKKKCEDLRSQLRRYQASIQESTVQECTQCFSKRTRGKAEVGVQTVSSLHLDGERSSIVQANAEAILKDHVKKLEREHETLKRLCRIRNAKISNLEQYIQKNNLPVPDTKENPEPARPAGKTAEKPGSLASRRVLTEIPGANSQF